MLAGKNLPNRPAVEIIALHLGATDELPNLIRLWEAARFSSEAAAAASDEWDDLATGLTGLARAIDVYSPHVICPMLQTKAYAQAMTSALATIVPTIHVDDRLQRQQYLQSILTDVENPVHLCVTLDEGALTKPMVTRAAMAEQYAYLLDLASSPKVTMRVIPSKVNEHSGVAMTAFRLLHRKHGTVAILETSHTVQVREDQRTVEAVERMSQYLLSLAQDPDQTRELISGLADKAREQFSATDSSPGRTTTR
jgi:hypothetical protein